MSLYLRKGSPNFVCELQVNGQRYRRSTGTSLKREARAFEARFKAELLSGHTASLAAPAVLCPTLGEMVERYWRDDLEPRQLRPRSAKSTRFTLDLLPRQFGANRPLDTIATADVSTWRSQMISQGLKPATVNRRLGTLRALLRKAVRYGVLQSVPHFEMCRLPAFRDRFISEPEFERIRAECPPHLRILATFLAGSGCRLGEALDLTWANVASDCSHVILVRTKSGKSRGVPLTREAREMLQGLPRGRPDQRVFLFDGRPYADPKRAWQKARARAGLPWVRLHDMRHLAASRLVRKGVSLYMVGRWLGHASPSTTQRYAAICQEDLVRAVAVLG